MKTFMLVFFTILCSTAVAQEQHLAVPPLADNYGARRTPIFVFSNRADEVFIPTPQSTDILEYQRCQLYETRAYVFDPVTAQHKYLYSIRVDLQRMEAWFTELWNYKQGNITPATSLINIDSNGTSEFQQIVNGINQAMKSQPEISLLNNFQAAQQLQQWIRENMACK